MWFRIYQSNAPGKISRLNRLFFLFWGGRESKVEEYLTWPATHLRNIKYPTMILRRENQIILLWHEARVRL